MALKLKHNTKPLNLSLNAYSDTNICLSDRLPDIKPSATNSTRNSTRNLPSSLNHIPSPSNMEAQPRSSRGKSYTNPPPGSIFSMKEPRKSHFLPPIQLQAHGSAPTVSQTQFEKPLHTWSDTHVEKPLKTWAETHVEKPLKTWSDTATELDDKHEEKYEDKHEDKHNQSNNKFMFMPGFTLTQEESKEECKVRYELIKSNMKELCAMEVIDGRNKYYYEKEYIIKDTEKACKLAESVLCAMGVQVRSFVGNACDSSMMINPIKEKVRLGYFYKLFIPEMCKFNYIFLSKLRLNTISVCESVRLQSKEYLTVLNQKLHNGLFPLEKMVDRRSVQQHWFKVILYHFIKLAPEAYAEWQEILKEHETGKIKAFEELLVAFNYMMGVDREMYEKVDRIKMKENFLREKFSEYGLLLDGDETRKHRDE